ncbi:hypothetical protein OO015_05285 [Thermomicrobium sp. 4228-Ro]|uniref:hypothetical protein n=1 Tax=Thermomicrobium sp. 4228-Ro TaxID=2993937 RepID=UPI002248D6D0|nr:hypothetical protein [Thermomicrobium sp. 4228-Ro]MCX2726906.1 hypothetical protein [Thermomicrobium sp. 4228-Ro]
MEDAAFLVVLASRCVGACDRFFDAALSAAIEGALATIAIVGLVFGFRQWLRATKWRRLRAETVAGARASPVNRSVELTGRATSDAPQRAPLSGIEAAGYRLQVKALWRRRDLLSNQPYKYERIESEDAYLDSILLDDGTGRIRVDVTNAQCYWPEREAEWAFHEAPEWVLARYREAEERQAERIRRLNEFGYKPLRISVSEEVLPLGSELYVIGRLTDPDTLVAEVASTGGEQATRRALRAEAVTAWLLAIVATWFAIRLLPWLSAEWATYSAGEPYLGWRVIDYGLLLVLLGFTAFGAAVFALLPASAIGRYLTFRGNRNTPRYP